MTTRAQTVTILFTDLVGSTELLQRAGDEQAQRIFKAHHRLLREAVEAHGGHEVKWLGDGLMVAFDSTADAVKCAIAMQQASRRPTAGERLEIRAGLNVGEAFVDESDYFGTSVVVARRLCDSGIAGQIRASDIVVRLLDGRGDGLQTKDLGALDLKGIINPVPAVEIVYAHDPMALLRRLPFVGRSAEYETMLKKLGEARNSRGSVILLAGEPGIGKTRLTEEFCEHASSGATVIRGNCYDGDVAAPFGPWTEALHSLLEQTPDSDLREVLGPGAPDIATIIPDIRKRIPDLEQSPPLEPEAERARLFDSINAWLKNAAEKKPLVIFLDDLHWCDRPSLALLEQVARNIVDRRIVVVGTYRDVEVDRVHPLAQALAGLRRMEHHERIAIRGFTQESVQALLAAIEPSESTSPGRHALAQVLHDETEGNPFFLREVLNNLVETGKLVQRDGVWVGAVASMEEMGVPEGIKEVIGRRLSRLSETCNRMLGRASAMTGGFTWDELRAICDESEDGLLDALDEALGSQLMAERERNVYAFTHALIRATLYDELNTPRRVQLHRRIGEALERLHAGRIDEHLPELAHHFFEAASGGDLKKAIDYCVRAGDAALAAIAYEDAVRHLERALFLTESTDNPDEAFRCRVLLRLGDAQARTGNVDRSDLTFDRAGQLALSLSRNDMLVDAALGAQSLAHGTAAVNVALLEAALDRLEPGDSIARTRCMARLSPAFAQDARGGELARGAVVMAERLGDTASLMHALASLHRHLFDAVPDRVQDRIEVASRILALAEEVGDREMALVAGHCNLQGDLIHLGEMKAADVHIAAHSRLSEELRQGLQHGHTLALQAMRAQLRGQYADADNLARNAFEFRRRIIDPIAAEGIWYLQRFAVHWDRASLGEFANVTTLPPIWDELLRGLVAVESGERPAAPELLDRLVADGDVIPVGSPVEAFQLALCAELCSQVAHTTSAPLLLQRLARYEQRTITLNAASVVLGAGARYLGMLEVVMGDWDNAERHMEVALDVTRRLESPPWIARTQHDYARTLLARGAADDRERALALNAEALSTARELGMRKVAADCERLLASAGA